MKHFKILLCLFLCLHQPLIQEKTIEYYEQAILVVSKEDASNLSKEIHILQNKISKDIFTIHGQIKKREKEKKTIYVKRLKNAKKRYLDYHHRLQKCQDNLLEKYSQSYQTFESGGRYEEQGLISGQENLPVFGGMKPLQKNRKSCPSVDMDKMYAFSSSWNQMVQNGTISAGTWAYPGGGLHLGLDVAAPMYSNIYAPANGIVLYASAPVDSNNGYLGNYCGWPQGGGNTIATIMAINDTYYGVTLAHLSNQIHVVAGQAFEQGMLLAQSGNSGNSTGPHVHIEIFQIKTDLESAVSYFRQGADFSFGNGFSAPATCSAIACRIRPETVL